MKSNRISILGGLAVAGLAVLLATTSLSSTAAPAADGQVGQRVDNFMLPDQAGVGHELYYHAKAKAVVILTVTADDATSRRALAELSKLKAAYAGQGVEFVALDSGAGDTREAIAASAAGSDVAVLADELQLVGRALGVTRTGEVFVVKPGAWTVAYHGPLDASFADKAGMASLGAALDSVLAGKAPSVAHAGVKGAVIAFPDRDRSGTFSKISYAREVAPILADKCVVCHTKGGMGPFAMDSYTSVKAWAPMIRESLRTKRMPPFHADPHWGEWSNDMALTADQIKTVVYWVEGGAPRGDGADALASMNYTPPEWPLGQPDLIVQIPEFTVPASGIIDYQNRSVATNLTEGKWLKATAWSGASATVHHALAGWMPQVRADGRGFSWNTALGGYGPGGEANLTPADTGIFIPAGGSFSWQMHYTSNGKETRDATKVGYYFYKEAPTRLLRQTSITDFSLEIPAGEARHREVAYLEFPADAEIFGVQPHCHSRCYSTKLTMRLPDGTERVLLNQPRYDFGWQREYHFKELLQVPAGAKLIAEYVFDNSTGNPNNPDPTHKVVFGEQTSEEMLFTFIRFRFKGETVADRHDEWMTALQAGVTFGALDDNIDGKLDASEFRGAMFGSLKAGLPLVDVNKDGALDRREFSGAMRLLGGMRGAGAGAARGAATGGSTP